uniref:Uncharacterized protein n=1 Tax=Anopheles coluzzii TaxID=1518534 RepID=A0A8W7NZQ9_ANOCL
MIAKEPHRPFNPALQQPVVRQLVQHDQLDQHAQLLPAPLRIDTAAFLLLLRLASVAVVVVAQLQVLPDDGAIAGPLLVAPLPDALQQRLQHIAGHQAAGDRCPYLPVVVPVEPEVPEVFIAHLEPGERAELGQQARRKLLDRLVLPPDRRVPDAAQAEPPGVDAARQKDARLDREHVQVPERLQMVPVVVAVRGELREDRADEGRYRLGRPGQREPAGAQKQKPKRHMHRHVRAVRHVLEADARPQHADGAQHAQTARAGQHEREGEQQHYRAVLDHLAADEPGQAGGRFGRALLQPDALLDEVLQVVVERLDGRLAGGAGVPQPDRDRTPAHDATVRLAVQHLLELGQPVGEGGSTSAATITGSVRLLRRLRGAHCVVLRLLLLLLLLLWSIAREGNVLP